MNKKATWAWADALYWFLYIPLTLIVIVALITVPTSILNNSVQPIALDATIMQQRIENSLTKKYSPTEGQIPATNVMILSQISKFQAPSINQKKYGIQIDADGTHYINKEYYEKTKDLVGMGYKGHSSEFFYSGKDGIKMAKIKQVYPPRYEQ